MRSKIRIDAPWESYLDQEFEATVIEYDNETHFLVVLDNPILIANDEILYLVGHFRGADSCSLKKMSGKKVDCSFIKTTSERVNSNSPVDVSWWRGGGAFSGSLKVI